MNANRLYSTSPERSNNSYKLHLNCQSKIVESPDTKDWLELEEKIDHSSADYHIYRGLLEKKKSIVAKVSRAGTNLRRDYEVGVALNTALRLPTLLDYYCMFECLDHIKELTPSRKSLCKPSGEPIQVILMPYVNGKPIHEWLWVQGNFGSLKNVIKHLVLTTLYAAATVGFVHKDIHTGNIMIKRTQRKEITYGDWGSLELEGVQPVLMDYDRSFINKEGFFWVYDDLRGMFSKLSNTLNTRLTMGKIESSLGKLFTERAAIDKKVVDGILGLVDKIEIAYVASELPPMPKFAW